MTGIPLRTTLFVAMLAAPAAAQGFDDYPFLGSWTCGKATYTFTVDVFNDGTKDVFINEIAAGTQDFRITLASNAQIEISAVTATTMNLTSEAAPESVTCTRLP